MKTNVLIVDDEPNVRLNYRVTLETEGYTVFEAGSGEAALKQLEAQHCDLAILDLRMPVMDGLDLLAEMRQRGYSTPAVIITAYGDVPHAVQAMRLGAIDFLRKPITPELLRQLVASIIERHLPAPPAPEPPHDDFASHIVTAKRLLNLQDFAGAKKHLVRALELESNAEAFNLAGVLFEMQEDYDRAKKYYGQAIKLEKNYEPAQQNMRRIYELFHFGSSQEPVNLGDEAH